MNDIQIIFLFFGGLVWSVILIIITAYIATQYKRPIQEVTEVKFVERGISEIVEFKRDVVIDTYEASLRRIQKEEYFERYVRPEISRLLEVIPYQYLDISYHGSEYDMGSKERFTIKIKILPPKQPPIYYQPPIRKNQLFPQ